MISPPTSAIPGPKELTSPINPIRVGEAPPPTRKAMGTVRDTIIFLSLGELTMDNAARPAGKKQTATSGGSRSRNAFCKGGCFEPASGGFELFVIIRFHHTGGVVPQKRRVAASENFHISAHSHCRFIKSCRLGAFSLRVQIINL